MKKLLSVFLCAFLIMNMFVPAFSAVSEEKIQLDDGSYLVISEAVSKTEEQESTSSFLTKIISFLKRILEIFKSNKTVIKTKNVNYYSADDERLWCVTLTGEFSYNGKEAFCLSSELSYVIFDLDWKLSSSAHSESGNVATGSFVMKQYKLGVPLKEISRTVTLICDKNGNVV